MSQSEIPIILADSITHVPDQPRFPRVVLCGSHGGLSAAIFALKKGVRGVIFNDAGGGKDQAGIAGLALLEKNGIYAAAVGADTAKIGIAKETEGGTISFLNMLSEKAGIQAGMSARKAAEIMQNAPALVSKVLSESGEEYEEQLTVIHTSPTGYRIVAMDSNSLVTPDNRKDIILTGSHGGLVGLAPVVKYPVIAAFYNDAGIGKEQAGITRLPRLQEIGIIGAAVDAHTARIGVGMETYKYGIISHANQLAMDLGIVKGMRAYDAAWRVLREKEKQTRKSED
ncbi:MAG: hypothetical protein H6Q43_2771, partial [Deltaproteobacteria bacterium]|nr:hypothetical protein [Deltaproteobacteria bacterium]MBP1719333.1 hypothetical protein [Deltaproteobacteria bacterium]